MLEQLVGDSPALDRALAGEELSYNDGLELMNYDNLLTKTAIPSINLLTTVIIQPNYLMNINYRL